MKKTIIIIGLVMIIFSIFFIGMNKPIEEDKKIVMSEFELTDINGMKISINGLRGKKTLINFWATWCRPCRKEMPMLNGLYLSQNPADLSVVGIAIDKPEKVIQFVAELGIDFPIMVGQSEAYEIMKILGNEALTLPYTILINEEGEVIWSKNTELNHSDMDEIMGIQL
jgi:peroxiredoxin